MERLACQTGLLGGEDRGGVGEAGGVQDAKCVHK